MPDMGEWRHIPSSDYTPTPSPPVLKGASHCSRYSVAWMRCLSACLVCLLVVVVMVVGCEAQGRLVDPPSRASMWRYDFSNPVDFNDDRVDCGGFVRQWRKNQGRCGVCGDPWDLAKPRPHETRGRYARGIIVRNFTQAQAVVVEVEVTAAGNGHFEYRLCPRISVWTPETQECFTHPLKDDLGRSRIPVNVTHKFARLRHVLRLPQEVVCLACVLQWKFVTEGQTRRAEYRACADVTIHPVTTTTTTTTTTPLITTSKDTDNTTITPVTTFKDTDNFTTTTTTTTTITTTDTSTDENVITESLSTTTTSAPTTLASFRDKFGFFSTQMSDINFGFPHATHTPTLESPRSQGDAPHTHTRTQHTKHQNRSSDTDEKSGAKSEFSGKRHSCWFLSVVLFYLTSLSFY